MDPHIVTSGPSKDHPSPHSPALIVPPHDSATPPALMEVSVDAPAKRSLIEEPERWSVSIKKPRKASKKQSPPTTVSNSFQALANQPTEAESTSQAPDAASTSTATPSSRKPKLPPPIIFDPSEYSTSRLAGSVRSLNIKDFRVQTTRSQIKLFFNNHNDYQTVTATLKSSHNTANPVFFHTYAPAGSKPNQKFLIIGLDKDHSLDDIRTALQHDDLIDVRRLTTVREGVRYETANVLVTFKPTYDYASHLSNIKVIDNIIVRHKPFVANRAQPICGKCQAIGHTKRYCWRPPKCANCGETHTGVPCSRESPKCANCKGDHPASYRQCPSRLKLLEKAKAGKTQPQAIPTTSRHPPPAPENRWGKTQASHLFHGAAPQVSTQPLPNLLPSPPTLTATPLPEWATQLTNTLTGILNALVATVQNLLTNLPQLLSK